MADRAKEVGLSHRLVSIKGAGHVPLLQVEGGYVDDMLQWLWTSLKLNEVESPALSSRSVHR